MDNLRPLLTTYAYNITGSLEDSKDIVQDAFLKFMQIDTERIENKKAYLVRTVINLAINQKNRQQKLVDSYPGHWLPEPVATESADTILNRKEVLSYSLMVLLEKLNPKERAVFILKEAFDYDHEEIAEVLELSIENSRKLLSRAKSKLHEPTPEVEKAVPANFLSKYLDVIRNGDTSRLEQLLHDDIFVISDGGGKAVAFRKMVSGISRVFRLMSGLMQKYYIGKRIELGVVNHQPALFVYENEKLATVQVIIIEDGKVAKLYFMRNPDKLKNLKENS
ncbi:sigma-70 family RNA polymerase sigma factor [Pseudoflavitalea sp. G-6-1-2]|uniref:sigma-70 family RNA polymerase sigma factor n=1 Tax=Pseudoflavitalea sp. G-6-1-2 TaxID=2728841 RepID=UPI001469D8F2|nr:sigma-70 family RNA polymerase sigma factor [Pseudoflavitalea sp. G-6-1-2]NML22799.1 sigma-70 family RNA polymerase sigma factor [Pseudoflavitalea sp. G-6-1-2]